MKKVLTLMLIGFVFLNADSKNDLKKLEKDISCYDKFIKMQEKKDSVQHLNNLLECVKKKIKIETNENYQNGIQIAVHHNVDEAKKVVSIYNEWKQKQKLIAKSMAKYILINNNENTKGYEHLEKGKNYYFVVVYQKNINIEILKNEIKKKYLDAIVFHKPQIVIDKKIKKIKRNDKKEIIPLLKKEVECSKKYNKEENLQRFMECLKNINEDENIEGIQIFLTTNKNKAKNEVKKYNEWKKNKNKELKKSKALLGEKYIDKVLHYSVVVTTSSSFKVLKKEIQQYSKKYSDAFKVKKPKVLIYYNPQN